MFKVYLDIGLIKYTGVHRVVGVSGADGKADHPNAQFACFVRGVTLGGSENILNKEQTSEEI